MYKKSCMAAAGNYPIDCVKEANLLPLPLLATSFFPPCIQTGMMWWRIWPRAQFPEQIWKPFLPPCRTNSACIQSAGRAFPEAPKPTPWDHSGFILDILCRLDGKTEEKQSAGNNIEECTVIFAQWAIWCSSGELLIISLYISKQHCLRNTS